MVLFHLMLIPPISHSFLFGNIGTTRSEIILLNPLNPFMNGKIPSSLVG